MSMNRTISRVLAAAVASAGFAVPVPTIAATISCTGATFSATPDGQGNINVSCTAPGTTTPPKTDPPPTNPPPPNPTPTPTDGVISCAGFTKTHVLNLNWGAPASAAPRVLTSGAGGFSAGEIVVARFTTPAASAAGVFAQIKSAEWGDQQHQRIASLSASPCDFSTGLGRLAMTTVGTTSPAITYAVGGSSAYYAILKPSTTYYLNIKNVDCGAGESCNMFVELQKPKGL